MRHFKEPEQILGQTALLENFLELVKLDTQSDENSETSPSTEKQLVALERVKEKLLAMGLSDAAVDEKGYLYATLAANVENAPTIGLIAHIDTAPDFSGANVSPILHKNYGGGEIALKNGVVITLEDSPMLKESVGDTVITSDGTTLLGADDKAGVAEILAALEILVKNPEIKRPTIRVGITPDEEIGRGAEGFDVKKFGAKCAYTLDGGWAGEINGETFSADGCKVKFTGVSVHPGTAKGKMVSAIRQAAKFVEALPVSESPEQTSGREGFYHPVHIEGGTAEATVALILRDFDGKKLAERGEFIRRLAEKMIKEEPRLQVEVNIKETYRNMAEGLAKEPEVMDLLLQAVEKAGISPRIEPIRGGTDGSGLTAMGLPTPNIFTGGVNFHGPSEWISTRVMALAVCTVLNLVQLWAGEK